MRVLGLLQHQLTKINLETCWLLFNCRTGRKQYVQWYVDAKVDRAPLLALTGQLAALVVGTGNFQEVDLIRGFNEVAEFNQRVQSDSTHA